MLLDMEIPIGSGGSTIDGLVNLDGREVFLEVTFTSQELFEIPKDEAVWLPVEDMITQVIMKTSKKVCSGKQLAIIDGKPGVLTLGLNYNGADQLTTEWAFDDLSSKSEFSPLSALVVSPNFEYLEMKIYGNKSADHPLTKNECRQIENTMYL